MSQDPSEAPRAVSRLPTDAAGGERVRLVPHDPAWAASFEREAARLRALLGARLVEIRHFGSTAVPGLLAKPIVDMIAGLADFGGVEEIVRALKDDGWIDLPDSVAQSRDRRWLLRHDGRVRTHHLHLVGARSRAWRERVAFCEMLKTDPVLRADYEALKRSLAARLADHREAYTAAKEGFIIRAVRRGPDGA